MFVGWPGFECDCCPGCMVCVLAACNLRVLQTAMQALEDEPVSLGHDGFSWLFRDDRVPTD